MNLTTKFFCLFLSQNENFVLSYGAKMVIFVVIFMDKIGFGKKFFLQKIIARPARPLVKKITFLKHLTFAAQSTIIITVRREKRTRREVPALVPLADEQAQNNQ